MSSSENQLLRGLIEVAAPAAGVPEFFPPDSPFDAEQRTFLNGLFAGLYTLSQESAAQSAPQTELYVFFGSQTGTAEVLAKGLRKFGATKGFSAKVANLDSIQPADLAAMKHVLIVAATYGEGEPTDNAHGFYGALMATDAPPLPASLNYSVCGLGDSSYPHFNKVSRDLDARLEDLGATRAAPLVTCDVDYETDYESWREEVFIAPAFADAAGTAADPAPDSDEPSAQFDKHRPFIATLIRCDCLNGEGSAKTVNHVEIALTGGGVDLNYAAGDALGIYPLNDMADVDLLLQTAGLAGTEVVELKNGRTPLRQALFRSLDLTTVTEQTARAWEVATDDQTQLIDALRLTSKQPTPQQLVDSLRPLQPRLYSIASSPNLHPGEVHLTVAEVHYELQGLQRKGVASTYLGARLHSGAAFGVYVQPASHFALPENDETPLIMIGPGTGVAPFRAFLEERDVRGANGRNWLFFGDQHEATDFLYKSQICGWRDSGLLTRLSLAWSRDSEQKTYVQHLIAKDGHEFFCWLEDGAAIYICGDAARMAPDVEAAILEVIAQHGAMSPADAKSYLDNLRKTGRYRRDVY